MNQTFSLARFARLNRWLWATKSRTYLIGAVAFLVIILFLMAPVLSVNRGVSTNIQESHVAYFLILGLLLMGSVGSDVFSVLFRQESAITYLMIPASRTEKFWLGALYCLLALLLLTVAFFGCEAITFSMANARLPVSVTDRYLSSLIYFRTPPRNVSFFWLAVPTYTLLLTLPGALLGSFFFRRGVFIRNVGMVLLCVIGLTLVYNWLIDWQFTGYETNRTLPFSPISVYGTSRPDLVALPTWFTYAVYLGTLLALWVIARVRFNEIER